MTQEAIRATYELAPGSRDVDPGAVGRTIALEQTVEAPEALLNERIEKEIVGRVERIEDRAITIAYPAHLACGGLPQLLNLVYGNVSLRGDLRLAALDLPAGFVRGFAGPRFGIEGLRERTGVRGRPLLATALKPRGAPAKRLAEWARAFAAGGGDLVKDDHNLVETERAAFRERVVRFRDAVAEGGGGRCLYAANLAGPVEELEARAALLEDLGVAGALVAPFTIGLDAFRALAARHPALFFLAHPTFGGSYFANRAHGVAPAVLLGTLLRLAGADVVIFPGPGGRYATLTDREAAAVATRLRAPLHGLRPALPSPGGGLHHEIIERTRAALGPDHLLLIGGALLTAPEGVEAATARLREVLEAADGAGGA